MGLVDELGYSHREPNAVHEAVQALASSKGGAWLFSRLLHHVDRFVVTSSGDRTTATNMLAGLSVIHLTTTGAKTGAARTAPLLGIPTDGHLAVIGSGWGQRPTPGWVFNLRAEPTATVSHRGTEVRVVARAADGDNLDQIWASARELYDGYARYPARASHRDIAVFVLEPAGG